MRISRTLISAMQVAALLTMTATLGACGGGSPADDESADAMMEAADPAPAADEEPLMDAEGADDDIAAEPTTVPDWFPQDVYLPSAYSVVAARNLGAAQQVELRVAGEVEALRAEAHDAMQSQGWKQAMDTGETRGYTKDKRIANLTVAARDEGGARVAYQFSDM